MQKRAKKSSLYACSARCSRAAVQAASLLLEDESDAFDEGICEEGKFDELGFEEDGFDEADEEGDDEADDEAEPEGAFPPAGEMFVPLP